MHNAVVFKLIHIRMITTHQRMEARQQPTVNFRAFRHGQIKFSGIPLIGVGVERKHRVDVLNGAEELGLHFL